MRKLNRNRRQPYALTTNICLLIACTVMLLGSTIFVSVCKTGAAE